MNLNKKDENQPIDGLSLTTSYINIGNLYWKRGDFNTALKYYMDAKESCRFIENEHDRKIQMAKSLGNIALILDDMGKFQESLEKADKSLEIFEELGQLQDIARYLLNTGTTYYHRGLLKALSGNDYNEYFKDFEEAIKRLELSIDYRKSMRDYYGCVLCLNTLCNIFFDLYFLDKNIKNQSKYVQRLKESISKLEEYLKEIERKSHPEEEVEYLVNKALYNILITNKFDDFIELISNEKSSSKNLITKNKFLKIRVLLRFLLSIYFVFILQQKSYDNSLKNIVKEVTKVLSQLLKSMKSNYYYNTLFKSLIKYLNYLYT